MLKYKNYFFVILAAAILFALMMIIRVQNAKAFNFNWVTCHKHTGNHCSTQQFLNGCVPTWSPGACPTATASPVPTVSPTSTPEPTQEPEATPEATLVPEVHEANHFEAGNPSYCDGYTPSTIVHAFATRVGNNALIAYWPTVVGGTVNVRFKEVGVSDWAHALRDYPNFGVAPIGFLKTDVKYDFQLTNGNGCNQSSWSPVFKGL